MARGRTARPWAAFRGLPMLGTIPLASGTTSTLATVAFVFLDNLVRNALDFHHQDLDLRLRQHSAALLAKAGIRDFFRPLARTPCNSVTGTMARKSGSLSGSAGPNFPSLPWHPAQFCPYRTPNSRLWSGGTGRSARFGRPGKSHPVISQDRVRTRNGVSETKDTSSLSPTMIHVPGNFVLSASPCAIRIFALTYATA